MEREVGGGIGMGNTCKPMAVSFQCITKCTTIKNNNNNFKKLQKKETRSIQRAINIDKQIIKYSTEQSRVTNIVWYSVAQSCSTVCDPIGCNLPGSSVVGFFRQEH